MSVYPCSPASGSLTAAEPSSPAIAGTSRYLLAHLGRSQRAVSAIIGDLLFDELGVGEHAGDGVHLSVEMSSVTD